MKNNLIKALILQLDYDLKAYSSKNYSYKAVERDEETIVYVTVEPSITGAFHGLQGIYSLIHERLCTHANIENGNLVITIF